MTELTQSKLTIGVRIEYYQFMLGFSVLGGISSSMVFTPSVACIAHWFLRRRALATGVAATAGGIGGVIFPVLITKLVGSLGFPWAIRIIGFISAVFCILSVAPFENQIITQFDTKRNRGHKSFERTPFFIADGCRCSD